MTKRPIARLLPALLLLLLLPACSGDDPTAPDPAAEPVAEAVIGSGGGSLGDDDVTVTVAPDAFTADAALALYRLQAPGATEAVTGRYRLEGLPRGAAVQVTLAAAGDLAGDAYLEVAGGGETALIPAVTDAGTLTATLATTASGKSDADVIAEFLGVDGIETFELPAADPFLRCRAPAHRRAALEASLAGVIALWRDLAAAGFGFSGRDQDGEWVGLHEMDVVVRDVSSESLRPGYLSVRAERYFLGEERRDGRLVIHREALDHVPTVHDHMLREAAFELMDLRLDIPQGDPQRLAWLPAAFAWWAEGAYAPEPPAPEAAHLLATLPGHYFGAHMELAPPVADYARGMARFLAAMVDDPSLGLPWLKALVEASRDGDGTPENLVAAFDGLSSDVWWHGWVEDLVGGEVADLGDVPFVNEALEVWSVNDAEDVSHVFTADYPDLSAGIFSVRLDHDGIDETARARFALDSDDLSLDDLDLQLWIRNGGTLTRLAAGTEIVVHGLRELRMSGAHLLAVVSNSYYSVPWSESRRVRLTVTVETAGEEPSVFGTTRCDVGFYGLEEFQHYEGPECWQADGNVVNLYTMDILGGAWSGTTYSCVFDQSFTEPVDHRNLGTLIVQMDATGTEVLGFSFAWTQEVYGQTQTTAESLSLTWTGGGLLLDPGSPENHHYELAGTAIGDHLIFQHIKDWSQTDCRRITQSWTAQDYALMTLEFAP